MIFQDWHLVVVLCIFAALHSSKSLLKLCENCETFCLSLCSTESTLSLIRNMIVMCCLSQPFLFCTVYIYKHATQKPLQFVLINTISWNQPKWHGTCCFVFGHFQLACRAVHRIHSRRICYIPLHTLYILHFYGANDFFCIWGAN